MLSSCMIHFSIAELEVQAVKNMAGIQLPLSLTRKPKPSLHKCTSQHAWRDRCPPSRFELNIALLCWG